MDRRKNTVSDINIKITVNIINRILSETPISAKDLENMKDKDEYQR